MSIPTPKRAAVVHYHLFKNAGTSVDRILQDNFGSDWTEIEGPENRKLTPEALLDFIRANPKLKAVSSHTAVISPPETDDIDILPIVFIRHPIDRIRSAYDFERRQDAQTPGAIKAKEGDFRHYMDWRLESNSPWQVKNFHAMRLKDFHDFTPALQEERFRDNALRAMEDLPLVGLVEAFDASMEQFATAIREHFEDFCLPETVRENVTSQADRSLDDNLQAFRDRIGDATYRELETLNADDFAVYNAAKARFS